jgi:hypothetical protein
MPISSVSVNPPPSSVAVAATKAPLSPNPASAPKSAAPATANNPASSAAVLSAATAALKEATETSAQTTKEAAHGDRAAQKILAKTQAAEAARSGTSVNSKAIGARIDLKA